MLSLLLPLVLVGVPKTTAVSPNPSPDTIGYRIEDVRYTSDSLVLAAELRLPAGNGPHPAAVIIQGSGASDRSNTWASQIAGELVNRGLAVLLTDKRGSGDSGGDWRQAGFDELADDALAGVEYLRTRREIDPARVGLVGLSQGGWTAPIAAARSEQVAFVIVVSGATVGFAEQSMVEMGNTARQAGLAEEHVQEVLALNQAAARYMLTGDWSQYAAARDRALGTPWSRIAAGFPGASDLPIWTFLRKSAAFDPMPYWLLLSQPVLVVYGAEDERDNVPVAESVRRLEHGFAKVMKRNYRTVVIPAVGHSLWITADPHDFAPEFLVTLSSWIEQYLTAKTQP
jgi:dipeptidyl aminopeptidase/acylaminoacyl peptidase